MNSNLIVKNTAPDPATPKSKTKLLAEVPEEFGVAGQLHFSE
jgi:hypothetical protein